MNAEQLDFFSPQAISAQAEQEQQKHTSIAVLDIVGYYQTTNLDLLYKYRFGHEVGCYVYAAFDEESQCLYVGKTTRGLLARIREHLQRGGIGIWEGYTFRIVELGQHDHLAIAEQFFIHEWQPQFNKVRYTTKTYAVEAHLPTVKILENDNLPPCDDWRTSHIRAESWGASKKSEDEPSIYSRAYRDPNHPDLRRKS